MYFAALVTCVSFAILMNFLFVYCIGKLKGKCGKGTLALTLVINILGLALLAAAAPKNRKDGANPIMLILFAYLGYITIKLIWGLLSTCKHLNQGLKVLESVNEVFVAKRVLCVSVFHLVLVLLLALLMSLSMSAIYMLNQFSYHTPTVDLDGAAIDWTTEENPLYFGQYSVEWKSGSTTFLSVQILVLAWVFKIITT